MKPLRADALRAGDHRLEVGVGVNTDVNLLQVQTQLVLATGVAGLQQQVDQVLAFGNIEALEGGAAELQLLGLGLVVAQRVGPRQHVLQRVFLARDLSLVVELEGEQPLVVPVEDVVFEVDGFRLVLAYAVHADLHGFLVAADVHEERAAHRELSLLLTAALHHHAELARLAAVVDAEAEQTMVAHAPEHLLVLQPLHAGVGKHAHHLFHLYLVAGDVVGVATLHLAPDELGHLIDVGGEFLHIGDVVGKIQLEVLCLAGQRDKAAK